MSAGDSSTISIVIAVEDGGSAAAVQNVERNIAGLGTAGTTAGNAVASATQKMTTGFQQAHTVGAAMPGSLNEIASTAEAAGARGAASFGQMGGAVQGVRLGVQELGLHVPRAMESIIAHNETLAAGLRATMGIFIAMGAIGIFTQLATGAAELYEKWFDVDKAVNDYTEKAQEAAQQKLFDTGSMETEAQMLGDVGTQLDALVAKKKAFNAAFDIPGTNIATPGAGLMQYANKLDIGAALGLTQGAPTFSAGDDQRMAHLAEIQKKGQRHLLDSSDKVAQQQLEGQQEYDAAVDQGYAKIQALEKDTIALINQRYAIMRADEADTARTAGVKPPDLDKAYSAEQAAEIAKVQQQASGERIAMTRQEVDAEIQMRNEAIDAGVRGEALYSLQVQQAEDAIRRKINEGQVSAEVGLKEISDLDMKAHNEKMVRLEQEQFETKKMQQEAAQAGLTGIAALQAEGQSKIADLNDPSHPLSSDQVVQDRRAAIVQQTNQKILEEQKRFQEEMDVIGQRSDQQMETGYARIEAETQRMLERISKDFKETYGQLNPADPAAIVGFQQEQQAITQVLADAQRDRVELTRKNDEQIAQIETQAARQSLPPWQQAQLQITDDYRQRVQKATDELNQQLAYEKLTADDLQQIWAQYYKTLEADAALANAQMQKQAEQSRDQIASQLQSMFDNPAKYLENRGKQMMFDLLANWVQQLMQFNGTAGGILGGIFGTNSKTMSTSSNPLEAIASVFGMHLGHGSSGTAGAASPMASMGSTLSSAGSTLSSSGTMLASSATQLSSAATALIGASQAMSGGGGGAAGAGQIGQLTSMLGGSSGLSGLTGLGGGTLSSAIGAIPAVGNLSGANSLFNDAASTVGMGSSSGAIIGGITQSAGQIGQMTAMLSSTGSTAASAPLLNPSGAMQPTDLPPTSSSGVPGTVPDNMTGTGATANAASAAGSAGVGIGAGLLAISTGMTMSQDWSNNNTGGAVLAGAMGGAGIGGMIGGLAGGPVGALIGMGIGAAGGALVGFIGSLFGDGGASKARKYNIDQVIPALQQQMDSYSGGGDYDSAMLAMNNLQTQAQKQCYAWGSGAVGVYKNTIIPEIQNAENQVNREGGAGRSNVTMSTAQFALGGWVNDFMDMSVGPDSGLILAHQGEHVMNSTAAALNAPWLDAMNRGLDMTTAIGSTMLARNAAAAPRGTGAPRSYVGGNGGSTAAPGTGSGGSEVHLHIHALDSKDVGRWLRSGGAAQIQDHLNANAARYAGNALRS